MKNCEQQEAKPNHGEVKDIKVCLITGDGASEPPRELHQSVNVPDVHQRDCALQAEKSSPVLTFSSETQLPAAMDVQGNGCEQAEKEQLQR